MASSASGDAPGRRLDKGVVPTAEVVEIWRQQVQAHPGLFLIIGSGTGSQPIQEAFRTSKVSFEVVAEGFTTRRARLRYFAETPRRGWRKLVPPSLQTPPCPVDDFAALILAEEWLAAKECD